MEARIAFLTIFALLIKSGSCDFSHDITAKNTEPEEPKVNPLCPSEEDPKYPTVLPHPEDCSKFYKCLHGKAYPIDCPNRLHWSTKLQRCDWPEVAECDPSIPTTKTPEGTTPPATDLPPTPAEPTEAPKKDPRCPADEDPKTPTVLPHPDDCSKFYKCLNGFAYTVSCPQGLHWSGALNRCDWPEVAKCDQKAQKPSRKDLKTPLNKEILTTVAPPTTAMPTSVTPPIHEGCSATDDPQKPILLANPDNCSKFYKCVNRRGYPMECPTGLHFSTKLGRCDWPEIAGCDPNIRTTALPSTTPSAGTPSTTTEAPSVPLDCPANEDPQNPTVLPYPGDCSKFYKCLNGRAYPIACPDGLHYSTKLAQCDWPDVAKCDQKAQKPSNKDLKTPLKKEVLTTVVPKPIVVPTTTVMPTSVTPPIHEGCPETDDPQKPILLANPDDCSKFYKCVNRRGYPMECPTGLHFSTKLGRCDWPEIAGCDPNIRTTALPSTTPSPGTPSTTTEAPSVPLDCPANEDPKNPTVLPYPGDCSKFYKCLNGQAYPIACPDGLHYSPTLERCDWPQIAKCDLKIPAEPTARPEYPSTTPTATNAPSTEAPQNKLILPGIPPKAIKSCSGNNQLFAHETDCTKFIQCTGDVAVEKSCPMGTHFNAQLMICDYPKSALCQVGASKIDLPKQIVAETPTMTRAPADVTTVPSQKIHQKNICEETADNSYLQHPQDCSRYVHCYNKQMFIQQCPPGLLWNHQLNNCDYKEKVDCNN